MQNSGPVLETKSSKLPYFSCRLELDIKSSLQVSSSMWIWISQHWPALTIRFPVYSENRLGFFSVGLKIQQCNWVLRILA